ncbi:hypothetical protein SADUNF_Sadunf13G0067100 [Salix dunnii]|uniref:Uncharacterized protein n=1 Tax=Salix dunnii TaxID=1413687 RepID=A0A835JHM6_9ROSI|nr:hypothetical protein SADUNF_Sadunf13G0067100 [Salix dunnii]
MIAPVSTCMMKCYKHSSLTCNNEGKLVGVVFLKEFLKDVLLKVQHHDFQGGYPSQFLSRLNKFNFGVLMGSDSLVLVRSHLWSKVECIKKESGENDVCNTRTSKEITHLNPSLAQTSLTLEF